MMMTLDKDQGNNSEGVVAKRIMMMTVMRERGQGSDDDNLSW